MIQENPFFSEVQIFYGGSTREEEDEGEISLDSWFVSSGCQRMDLEATTRLFVLQKHFVSAEEIYL